MAQLWIVRRQRAYEPFLHRSVGLDVCDWRADIGSRRMVAMETVSDFDYLALDTLLHYCLHYHAIRL